MALYQGRLFQSVAAKSDSEPCCHGGVGDEGALMRIRWSIMV